MRWGLPLLPRTLTMRIRVACIVAFACLAFASQTRHSSVFAQQPAATKRSYPTTSQVDPLQHPRKGRQVEALESLVSLTRYPHHLAGLPAKLNSRLNPRSSPRSILVTYAICP